MDGAERLWLLACFCQVISLTCEQHLNPVEVEVVFQPFPSTDDPDTYTLTCRSANNHLLYEEPSDRSACSSDCKISLRLVEDQRGYNITVRASRNHTSLEAKTFHFTPVSLSSLHVHSTTTSALLTWKLHGQQNISGLSLYNTRTRSVTHTLNFNSSEAKSPYTVNGLQPGTRYKAKIVVTTVLKHLDLTLKQGHSVGLQTAQCPRDWLANGRSCYSVRRRGLTWSDAHHSCRHLAAGSHLVDLKTRKDLLFISAHLLSHNDPLLLWTGLNDQQEEGRHLWSDGSAHNLTNAVMSSLPANQTDCFALQRNATGPGYFLTSFFCDIPLPYVCHYQTPLVPASFSFDLAQVTEQHVELRWSDLSPLNSLNISSFEIFLQYQEEVNGERGQGEEDGSRRPEVKKGTASRSGHVKIVKVPISLFSRGVTVAGLSPGSVYSFTLLASHPAGFTWSLGQTRTAYTRPLPPQNITVGRVTVHQISVHWMLTDAQPKVGWTFVVRYVDVSSGQEGIVKTINISKLSDTAGLQLYTAVIGGLQAHRKYRVEVHTVTQHGIESCGQASITIQTAVRAPRGLVVSSVTGNLTVCWTSPSDDPPDGFYITSHPLINPAQASLWINQSSPDASWVNESVCVHLGAYTPGQTYDVGVASLRGKDSSEKTSVIHTTDPMPVQAAVPLSVSTNSATLYIHPSQLGLTDGVKVCVCPGVCDSVCEGSCWYACEWFSLPPAGVHIVTLGDLSPGSEYQLRVHSTSRGQMGPPYHTRPVRTGLAPPVRLREGVVTDSSIELLWDPAQGQAHGYEVICLTCDHNHRVQKVFGQSAAFSGLTAGTIYHFTVRTEKESFADSSPVNISITAAPSPVDAFLVKKTTSSICIRWSVVRGAVSGLVLSIKNKTSNQELIMSHEGPRSYIFDGLAPGSRYTVEVISTSGAKKSKPTTMVLHTIPEVPREVAFSERVVTSVFVTWRPPPGQVDGYKLAFGLLPADRKPWIEVLVQGTSYEIRDLIPGSDYGVSIQSALGSDTSQAVHREFSTCPAGLCALRLLDVNSSSVSVRWDGAFGGFDFHRVTVTNTSVTNTLAVPKEELVAVVTGLADGCSYNVSAERVRGATAGSAASLTVTTVPARVRGLRVFSVSARSFSLRWDQAVGCVDRYQVDLQPDQGQVTVHPEHHGYIQADVMNVSPGTQYTAMVTAASSSNISPGVSRMITTNESVPDPPFNLEGETTGSNGILLSWTMPPDARNTEDYVIRYREVCPYPDPTFTEVNMQLDIPETLLNVFTPGSTYHIEVAAIYGGRRGAFSKSLYIKTLESAPGLVTNLTAFAQNHTFVVVTWFLPRRINGLITKFSVKAKHARTGQAVRTLEVNAEDIMTEALPHCNDAADILSRATPSPLEMTASSPSITLSAVPPAASWSVPISVGVDQLRPYTAYLFEVSAFTSEGEGQIASTMVRMPESAPEDPPQNFYISNMTSRSISVSWDSPNIMTGKFTYTVYLYGPTGYLYENNTSDMRFAFTGLTPYTRYTVAVRARAAGEVGPMAQEDVITPAEAPSAVQDLVAIAEDSVSIRVSWRSPAQPNGLITQYRLQVLVDDILLQDITLTADENTTYMSENMTFPPEVHNNPRLRKRTAELSLITSPPTFTATVSDRTLSTGVTASSLTLSSDQITNTEAQPSAGTAVTKAPGTGYTSASLTGSHDIQSTGSVVSGTSSFSPTSLPPATLPSWLTKKSHAEVMTSRSSPLTITAGQLRLSTHDATVMGRFSTRSAATSGTTGVTVREEVMDVLSEELSYLVSDLNPFTDYTFRVTASTTVGEGPAAATTEKTREQVPSSVLEVSYRNISSTSIEVSWVPPLNPNGQITHYTVYGLKLHNNEALKWMTNSTSIIITDLDKYTGYKLRVAASTAVGESSLSEEDDIFVFTLEDEPDSPPVNLTVQDTSPSTATLVWSAPEKANGVIQQYVILYHNESFSASVNACCSRVTLTDLKPFSYYNVSVLAYTQYGHGNQTSETLHLLSGEDVPGSPPYGLRYESISPSEVNVTWEPPLLPNGIITHYSVELWNSSHYLTLTSPTNYIQISHLRKYAHYRLTVKPHTRVGPGSNSSAPLNITTLEDAPETPPQHFRVRKLLQSEEETSQTPPPEANSVTPNHTVWNETTELWQDVTLPSVVANVDSGSLQNDAESANTKGNYSFTTMHPESTQNPSVPNWTTNGNYSFTTMDAESTQNPSVPNWTTNGNYSFTTMDAESTQNPSVPNWTTNGNYSFTTMDAESTQNASVSNSNSSLTTMDADRRSEPFDPPQNITFTNLTTSSVTLLWHPPAQPNGVIVHYTIYYSENNTLNEQRVPISELPALASPDSPHSYTLTQLIGGVNYTLWMTSSTARGDGGVKSEELTLSLPEDVPSGPVRNLTVQNFSPTIIIVSWAPPLEPNGRPYYVLTLQEADVPPDTSNQGTPAVNKTIQYTTISDAHMFTHLKIYFSYVLSVTPGTGAGLALNHTSTTYLRTDDDIPSSAPVLLSARNLSPNSIAVVWQRPHEANGEITEYNLTLFGPGGSNTTQTPNSSFTFTNLLPFTAYNLTITAATRKGWGPYLLVQLLTDEGGPMSPPRNLTINNHTAVSVWLSWEPPLEPNGVVIQYGFRIRDLMSHTVTHRNSSGPSTTEYLSGFRPHSSYEISVYSFTRVGHGNQFSSPVTFTTNESASDAVGNLSCSGLSWDSVQLFWEFPANPNGQILYYEILLEVDMQSHPHHTHTPNYTVSGLSPNQEYELSVVAVNSAGSGERVNCTASTLPESVPSAPHNLTIPQVTANNVTLQWAPPLSVPGLLREYHIIAQLLSTVCEPNISTTAQPSPEDKLTSDCVDSNTTVSVNASAGTAENYSVTVRSLAKYRYYRFKVAAVTSAGMGEYTDWNYARTLAGKPDAPPRDVNVTATSSGVTIAWKAPAVLSGPTSYLVKVNGPDLNFSTVRAPGELTSIVVTNLTVFASYNVTIIAFTGSLEDAARDGKAIGPFVFQTQQPAPAKPTRRPQVVLGQGGVAMVTHRRITIHMPACFYSDDNGPIVKIQVIVAESGVRDVQNLTNWKSAFFHRPAPYLTDKGFPNPPCTLGEVASRTAAHVRGGRGASGDDGPPAGQDRTMAGTYVIGENNDCLRANNTDDFCNGPLKPNTVYVFKFRATNIHGKFTDSEYSEDVKTAHSLLTRDEQIILGVLLSFALALLLIGIICGSVKFHQRQKKGVTYSPRQAEIIDTKFKLDQLIAVADLELKQEKINRYSSFFFRRKEIYVIQLLSYRKSLKPVNKMSFLQHVTELCANDNAKFQEEFAELPKLLQDLATTDADLLWNKSKNRFPNIKPYNNNRVKLLSEPGIAGSDYINASFVSGYLCPNEFIATQGPLPGTVADFWRMIWETGTHTIAMLTQCFEKGRIRCHKYWPEDNKPMSVFGDILISKVSEEVLPDWTVRTLKVEKHGDYILVRHFNYTSWPEHGVPESCSTLIEFVKAVRAHRHDNTTIVVHCSAGVGRTGVFIALDHLIQHVRDHDFVDVYGLVAELRSERMCMVQNLAQYIFLHQSTLELLNDKANSQSIWFVSYSALEKMDSLDTMEGDVELEWEETTM